MSDPVDDDLADALGEFTGRTQTIIRGAYPASHLAAVEGYRMANLEPDVVVLVAIPGMRPGDTLAVDEHGRLALLLEPDVAAQFAGQLRDAAARAHAGHLGTTNP